MKKACMLCKYRRFVAIRGVSLISDTEEEYVVNRVMVMLVMAVPGKRRRVRPGERIVKGGCARPG